MPIYRGSTRVHNMGTNDAGFTYLRIINQGGGKIFQPGNGRLYTNSYPRTNIANNSTFPAVGADSVLVKYQKGATSDKQCYDFGLGTSTTHRFPTGWNTLTNNFTGTQALGTSYISTNTSVTISGATKYLYGFKLAGNTPNATIDVYVYLNILSGYASAPTTVRVGYYNGSTGNTLVLTAVSNIPGLFYGSINYTKQSAVWYISLPIVSYSTIYGSAQKFGVQSYYSFRTR